MIMYKVVYSKKMVKFLDKQEDSFILMFNEKIKLLKDNPKTNNLDIKKLKSTKDKYRLRIWKYRFLYKIIDDKLLVYFYDAGSRWDIYK